MIWRLRSNSKICRKRDCGRVGSRVRWFSPISSATFPASLTVSSGMPTSHSIRIWRVSAPHVEDIHPNVAFHVLSDVGHWAQYEASAAVNALLPKLID